MEMTGNTVLITGGTSGIGFELASQLSKHNTVIVTGRDPSKLELTKTRLKSVHTIQSDASDPTAIAALSDRMGREFPALNVLINNAGIMRKINLQASNPDLVDLTREIEINLSGPIRMVERFSAVVSEDIRAPYPLPPFDNSAVDGYAFRYADLSSMKEPIFRLLGETAAGAPFKGDGSEKGSAVRISTGAVLPAAYDTIAMREVCQIEGGHVRIVETPVLGASVRRAGNDIEAHAVAITKGHRLHPQDIALLHALGQTHVPARPKLRVAIVSTGLELQSTGSNLASGQIIDTNGLMLKQIMANRDAAITLLPSLPDEYETTRDALNKAAAAHDIIISTGGISVGDRDFVRDMMHKDGKIHFWKTAIKPGRPVLFGQIGDCYMACLPGNPVSAMVTFFLIVHPLIEALMGLKPALPPAFQVPLAAPVQKETHVRMFSRAKLSLAPDGRWHATPYRDQSSNLLTSLAGADGLLDLPVGASEFAANDLVLFRPFAGLL